MNPLIPRGPYRVIGDAMHPRNKRITSQSRPHIAKVYATDLTPDPVADALANAFAALPDLIEGIERANRLIEWMSKHIGQMAPGRYIDCYAELNEHGLLVEELRRREITDAAALAKANGEGK